MCNASLRHSQFFVTVLRFVDVDYAGMHVASAVKATQRGDRNASTSAALTVTAVQRGYGLTCYFLGTVYGTRRDLPDMCTLIRRLAALTRRYV